jgi:type I restriction enzyme M protein
LSKTIVFQNRRATPRHHRDGQPPCRSRPIRWESKESNIHHTFKTKPLKRPDLDEFVECYNPQNRYQRESTWNESNPEGRWRCFAYDELAKRDKLNLDIFWFKDTSLEDARSLPEPDVLAQEIAEDLQAAMELFAGIANELKE